MSLEPLAGAVCAGHGVLLPRGGAVTHVPAQSQPGGTSQMQELAPCAPDCRQ